MASALEIAAKELSELIANANSSETAIEELAGVGRTTETVKGNATDLITHKADYAKEVAQVFNVVGYGALGDGTTDDTIAVKAAITAAELVGGVVYFPEGTYLISEQLDIPGYVSILGSGAKTIIKTNSAITMISFTSATLFGNRYGTIGNLLLDGNGVATTGLLLGNIVVLRRFVSIQINNINGVGLILDASQNCEFTSVDTDSCLTGLKMLNGAGNNLFARCNFNDQEVDGIVFETDASFSGYNANIFGRVPQANEFLKCIVERGTAPYSIRFVNAKRNVFRNCDLPADGTSTIAIVSIDSGQTLNEFDKCTFVGGGSSYGILNNGFRNYVKDCMFESFAASTNVIQTYNQIIIERPHLADASYRIVNLAGDRLQNVLLTPIGNAGTTAQRPNYGSVGVFMYWDTTLGKPIWWNGTAWKDATGATV